MHAKALLTAGCLLAAPLAAQRLDYDPPQSVVLNTNFTTVTPVQGVPINVAGGIFRFRNVRIRPGVTVRGEGTNPMIWIVSGSFTVEGKLTVQGGDGSGANTLNSANFPVAGGAGQCGGGSGGFGSPNSTGRSISGEIGFGAGQTPNGGGNGGRLSCTPNCNSGSGGGGGANATAGDLRYTTGMQFAQLLGLGGAGCRPSGSIPGGSAGTPVFADMRTDNDFWGASVDLFRGIPLVGELGMPLGGQGGGGGGDRSTSCAVLDPTFVTDAQGGGGGGGGGVLVIFAGDRVVVTSTGWICADGGHGGGGSLAASSTQGGGGGGGAGGTVLVLGARGIDLHARGETYANRDYDFSISADGGVSLSNGFQSPPIGSKYPANGQPPLGANVLDARAFGGMGGMGLIQLYAPYGVNADGTNTILDDGIRVFVGGQQVFATEKQRYLGWRGFPQPNGTVVDDAGNPVSPDEGDIRPAPVLIPLLR